MKRLLIFGLVFLSLIFGVNAALNDSISYWALEDLTDSSGNGNNLTNVGATANATGILNNAYSFDGINDYLYITGGAPTLKTDSVNTWFKCEDVSTYKSIWQVNDNDGADLNTIRLVQTTGYLQVRMHGGTTWTGSTNYCDGNWYMVTFVGDSTTWNVYINESFVGSGNYGGFGQGNDFYIGSRNDLVHFWNGTIDEISIWPKQLNSTEISTLWNNGQGFNPYDIAQTPVIQHNIQSFYNVANISIQLNTTSDTNMSYVLDSGNETSICNNCNSTILNLTSLSDAVHNIILISTDENGQANVSVNFTIDTQPANVSVNNFTEWNNGYNVTNLNVTLNITCTDPNLDYCEIHWDDNTTTNLSSTNWKYFSTNGNHTFTLHSHDLANNTADANGTIFINPLQYVYFNDSNNTQITNFTINGTIYQNYFNFTLFDYGYGNHTFEFAKVGYDTTSFTLELNTTSEINKSYAIPGAKIKIFIYDRTTRELINGTNVTIELAGPFGASTSTISGTANISSLSFISGSYTILASATGYESESKGFAFTNQEIINLSVYMLQENLNDTGVQNVYVENGFGVGLENILVKLNEWYASEGIFKPVSEKISQHPFGKVSFDVEYKTKIYRICAYPDSGEIFCHNDTTLTENSDDIYIPILESITTGTDFFYSNYSIACTNTSIAGGTQFDLTFADPTTAITKFCMVVFSKVNTTLTEIEEKCVNSYEGAISESYIHSNSTIMIAKGFAYVGSESIPICEVSTESTPTLEDAVSNYGLEIILPVLFALVLCGIGYAKKKLWYAITALNILMWCFAYAFPSMFTFTMALIVNVISLLAFIIIIWRNS